MLADFTPTSTYNDPILHYAAIGAIGAIDIPLTLTGYTVSNKLPKTTLFAGIPLFNTNTNNATGGVSIGIGTSELPKITLQGIIDTPMVLMADNFATPTLRWIGDQSLTYGDFIVMCMEGRAAQDQQNFPIIDPAYFRDPYGRQYVNPRVLDFQGQYTEGAPGRQSFTMVLQVTRGYDT